MTNQDYFHRMSKVEESISLQFELPNAIQSLCKDVRRVLANNNMEKSTFAAVQLKNVNGKVIETIGGIFGQKIPNPWNGILRHHIDEKHSDIRDIQADVVLSEQPMSLVVTGWHEKFDKWVYDEYKHKNFVRIWIPILILRDDNGEIIQNWMDDFPLESCQIVEDPLRDPIEDKPGRMVSLVIPQASRPDKEFDIIGTLEAGFYEPGATPDELIERFPKETIYQLTKLVAEESESIYKCTISHVFDTITQQAKAMVHAKSASLHFLRNSLSNQEELKFHITSCSGDRCSTFLKRCPIHKGGSGDRALSDGKLVATKEDKLQKKNPKVCKNGIKMMVAAPVKTTRFEANPAYEGILYVHFDKDKELESWKIESIKMFAEKATNAILNMITYVRMRTGTDKLKGFEQVSRSIIKTPYPNPDSLNHQIAGIAKNILAADIVTIYTYDSSSNKFFVPWATAGRLKRPREDSQLTQPMDNTGPKLMLKKKGIYFASDSKADQFMNKHNNPDGFIVCEDIVSSVGRALRVADQVVGVMFIHYRHFIEKISNEDKDYIDMVASWAAISINQRNDFNRLSKQLGMAESELEFGMSKKVPDSFKPKIYQKQYQQIFSKKKPHNTFVISIDIRKSTQMMLHAVDAVRYTDFITDLEKTVKRIILDCYGIMDKFTGDGILAHFPYFLSKQHAGLCCIKAAIRCQEEYPKILDKHQNSFRVVQTKRSLGIGIDFGPVNLHIEDGDLIAVGTPVVYACRLSSVDDGTVLNQQAKAELEKYIRNGDIEVDQICVSVKNEAECLAYELKRVDKDIFPSKQQIEDVIENELE